LTIKQRLGMLF